MSEGKHAFAKQSGRNDRVTKDAQQGRETPSEHEIIIVALPCEICDELCPSDKLMDHQRECQKERETARRNEPRTTHGTLGTQEFIFDIPQDSLPVHHTGFIEVQRGYSPTIEFEDDCIANESSENDIESDFLVRGERSTVYFSPAGEESFATSASDISNATYIEIQRSYSPMMEFGEENSHEVFSHNIPEFINARDSTSSYEHMHPARLNQAENQFDHGRNCRN